MFQTNEGSNLPSCSDEWLRMTWAMYCTIMENIYFQFYVQLLNYLFQ